MASSMRRLLLLFAVAVCFVQQRMSAADDWPMLGRDATGNAVSTEATAPIGWDVKTSRHIKWSARLGTACVAEPAISGGLVWIGTNNTRFGDNNSRKDAAVLMCFREIDGKLLYEYVSARLETGRADDWPYSPIGCTPLVEGDRLWFTTNRCESICLDISPLRRGTGAPSILWKVDMRKEQGVDPVGQVMFLNRSCSIASYQDWIYVVTTNGVDQTTVNIPAPEAPSLVCFDKLTGKVVWSDNSPGKNILKSQCASPLVMEIGGKAQVIVPQGDGWLRSFTPDGDGRGGSKLIWKFDMNFKSSKWILGGRGDRNSLFATPVYYKGHVYLANGQEPEHGEGSGRLVCIDPTKTGDISSELAVDQAGRPMAHRRLQAVDASNGERAVPNPNSGLVWEFMSLGEEFDDTMHRLIGQVAIADDLLVACDMSGLVHCLDARTGKRHWFYDAFAMVWSSPLIVDEKVYVTDDDGDVAVFRLSADPDVAMKKVDGQRQPIAEINMQQSLYAAPIYANGSLYLATSSTLFAVAAMDDPKQENAGAAPSETQAASEPRVPAGPWPQWRGPNRDNVSRETGLLQQWPAEGPPLAWQAEGIGTGISCLSVAGGRIVTLGYQGQSEYAVALDERTGELAWATRIGPAIEESRLMRWLAQRSPTLDQERAYVVTFAGELVCLEMAGGKELWRKRYVEDFGTRTHSWGLADYPLIDGDKLICAPMGKVATFVALDKKTGKVLWKSLLDGADRRGYAAIVTSEAAGLRQYITFMGDNMVGVAAKDGKLLWQYKTVANRTGNSHTPIVIGDHVLCSNGYGTGIALLKLVADKDAVAAEEVYFRRQGLEIFTDPTIQIGGRAYTMQSGTVLLRLDWKTGDIVWSDRIKVGGRISPTFADGRLYLFSSDGTAVLIEDTADGPREQGRLRLPDYKPSIGATSPVVAGGRLYLRDDNQLFCFDVRKDTARNPAAKPTTVAIVIPPARQEDADAASPTEPPADPRRKRTPKPIFVPTPNDVVEKMLELAAVSKADTLVDLGSGDGRIVIAAAKNRGANAIGYEIDKELVALSREKLKEAGVDQGAEIHQQDMYTADLSQVGVAAVYLYPAVLEKLKPQFAKMKPGSRIVSHYFAIPDVQPDRVIQFESQASGNRHRLLLYTTPLRKQTTADNNQQQP